MCSVFSSKTLNGIGYNSSPIMIYIYIYIYPGIYEVIVSQQCNTVCNMRNIGEKLTAMHIILSSEGSRLQIYQPNPLPSLLIVYIIV